MNSSFPKPPSRGAERLLNPVPPSGHSLKEQEARVVAQGMGREWSPLPSIAQQEANVALDVSLLAAPPEPEIVAETPDEVELFEKLLEGKMTSAGVGAVRSQYVGGAMSVEADLGDVPWFDGFPSAEWKCAALFAERKLADAGRLESEAQTSPSYLTDTLLRSASALRADAAKIVELCERVFPLRIERRKLAAAIEAEIAARNRLSEAEILASSLVSAPRAALNAAEAEAQRILSGPRRVHSEVAGALAVAKERVAGATRRV